MLQLTQEQVDALEAQKAPLQLIHPVTQQVYVLIQKQVYDLACGIVGGRKGRPWDDEADDDLIANHGRGERRALAPRGRIATQTSGD